jgi:hypothetical protein
MDLIVLNFLVHFFALSSLFVSILQKNNDYKWKCIYLIKTNSERNRQKNNEGDLILWSSPQTNMFSVD